MSFLDQLTNQKKKLKDTETVVTNIDGKRFVEKGENTISINSNKYGFVVDTKPDDIPILVTDFLYIGSQDCAASSILENYGIKRVLSLGIEVKIDVKTKFVECLDLPETDIRPVLNECLPYIHDAIENRENILVHCNAGVSRTSMVAIGYLVQFRNMTFDEAYDLVKEKRPAIQPNAGFRRQLKDMKPGNVIETL